MSLQLGSANKGGLMDPEDVGTRAFVCRVIEHWPPGGNRSTVMKRIAQFLHRGVTVLMVVDADRGVIVFRPDGKITVVDEKDEPVDCGVHPLLGYRVADLLEQLGQ